MGREVPRAGRAACACAVSLVSLVLLSDRARSADGGPSPAGGPGVSEVFAAGPIRIEDAPSIRIEANAGQADADVFYLARGPRFTAFFLTHGVEVHPARALRGRELALSPGAEERAPVRLSFPPLVGTAAGVEPTPERVHYFTGSDPDRWLRDIPTFAGVRYAAITGTDLDARADEAGVRLRWTLPPGTDPATLALELEGTARLTARFFQERNEQRVEIDGRVLQRGASSLGFEVRATDATLPLIVEARLTPAPEIGLTAASSPEGGPAIATAPDGTLCVAGRIPALPARVGRDAYVSRLSPDGRTVLSTTIFDHVETMEFAQAHAISAFMLIFSFLVLLGVYVANRRFPIHVS